MKTLITLSLVFAAQASSAKTLECYNNYFKKSSKPFITAKIVSNSKISEIKFGYKKYMENAGVRAVDYSRVLVGKEITTGHSPYKGNVRYDLPKMGDLILPDDLSSENLKEARKTGIGMGRGENAVYITDTVHGDGAGSHISYRLSCVSK